MSVSNTTVKSAYACNGVTVTFAIPFAWLLTSQIKVYVIEIATGIRTLQVLTTDYTYTPNPTAPTSIVMNIAPTADFTLEVARETSLTQLMDYINNGEFLAEDHEAALDKIVMMIQELSETQKAAILLNAIDIVAGFEQTLPAVTSLGIMRVNADTDAFEWITIEDLLIEVGVTADIVQLQADVIAAQAAADAAQVDATQAIADAAAAQAAADTAQTDVDALAIRVTAEEATSVDHEARITAEEAISMDHENRITNLELSGGGAGGSGSLKWFATLIDGAISETDPTTGLDVYKFSQGANNKIRAVIVRPSTLLATAVQKSVRFAFFTDSGADEVGWQLTTTLIKEGEDVASTANQNVDTDDTINTVVNGLSTVTLDISDVSGQINGIDIDPNDMLILELERIAPAGVDDASDAAMLPTTTQVSMD